MIKKLRLMLEYGCYPVWLHNEDDMVVDTLLPEELRGDLELDHKFDDLQARYEALFIDNPIEFSYIGFPTDEERQLFMADWYSAVAELKAKVGDRYIIVDDIAKSF